jgi:hypothetical protein
MRKRKVTLLLLIAAMFVAPLAFAGLKGSTGKAKAYTDVSCGSGVACTVSDGVMSIASDADSAAEFSALTVDNVVLNGDLISGLKASTELVVTTDALTAAETGKNYAITVSGVVLTLPAVAAGLEYTFLGGNGISFSVDCVSPDAIQYLGMSSGDKITAPARTDDSLTLIGFGTGKWRVKNMINTFTDGN